MARVPQKILQALKDARTAATLENARFGFPNDTVTIDAGIKHPKTMHPDEYIKEEIRLHHQTWVIAPLDRVIAWAERKSTAPPAHGKIDEGSTGDAAPLSSTRQGDDHE